MEGGERGRREIGGGGERIKGGGEGSEGETEEGKERWGGGGGGDQKRGWEPNYLNPKP